MLVCILLSKIISDYRGASTAAYPDWNPAKIQIKRYSEGKLYGGTLQTRCQPHLGPQRRECKYSPFLTPCPNRISLMVGGLL